MDIVKELMELNLKMASEKVENTGDSLRATVKYIDEIARITFPALGLGNMNFTFDSLRVLENKINKTFPVGHSPVYTTVLFVGVYVGETMKRNIPGLEWDYTPSKDIHEIQLIGTHFIGNEKDKYHVMPVKRVSKFWFDRTDTIFGWAEMIRDIQSSELNIENMDPFKWQQRPNGTSIRAIKVFNNDKKKGAQ